MSKLDEIEARVKAQRDEMAIYAVTRYASPAFIAAATAMGNHAADDLTFTVELLRSIVADGCATAGMLCREIEGLRREMWCHPCQIVEACK